VLLDHFGSDRVLSAEEWLGRAVDGQLDVDDVCLTFDDNLRCQYDVAAPLLRERGLTAFWFVASGSLNCVGNRVETDRAFRTRCFDSIEDFYHAFFRLLHDGELGEPAAVALAKFDPQSYLADYPFYSEADRRFRFVRDEVLGPRRYGQLMDALIASHGLTRAELGRGLWMDRDCLRHLHEDGHVIGLHSHSHPTRFDRLHPEEQAREYAENQRVLAGITGSPPITVAHPCNSYNHATLELLRDLGVLLGFRANMAQCEFSELEYPREDHANLLREIAPCGSPSSPAISRGTSR
jgi:peptidoglycan/xylan/chitin deacetylase (PgdA/CDA1 family)